MATAIADPAPPNEDRRFQEMIERVRTDIRAKFAELAERARAREAELLMELDSVIRSYQTQVDAFVGKKGELEEMRSQNKSNLNYPELRSMQQEFMLNIESKIKDLEQQLLSTSVHFEWDGNVSEHVSKSGRVQLVDTFTMAPKMSYKEKERPTRRSSRVGPADGDLDSPRVVYIDIRSGNIFISEKRNNRVQRFDRNGYYLSTLGSTGVSRMRTPDGVAIREDVVLVSQYDGHHVQMYSLLGDYMGRFGSRGSGEGELESPTGLAVRRRNNFLYVCERGNNRVQVFDQNSRFSCFLGPKDLECPIDIKLTEEEVFVLDEMSPSIHVFNHEQQLVRSLITNGVGKQTKDAYCFCIDMERNIYVTDNERNCIYIFDPNGVLVHQIGSESSDLLSSPCGIALDLRGRIVVVDRSEKGCLVFF